MKTFTKFSTLSIVLALSSICPLRAGPIADLYGGTGAGGGGISQGVLEPINTSSGVGTVLSDPTGSDFGLGISGLALNTAGTALYASTVGGEVGGNHLLTLDPMTGATLN